MPILASDCPDFKFVEFNPRRHVRGADAARFEVDGEWCWMSRKDIDENVKMFGEHPELIKGRNEYARHGEGRR